MREDRHPLSRRKLAKGAAWSVPAVAVAAAAPAIAASQTSEKFAIAFDGGTGANGYLQTSYLDFGLATGQASPFTLTAPVTITFNVVGLLATSSDQRDFTASTSNGTLTRGTYNAATKTTPFTWVIPAGTSIPTISTSTANPDVFFNWRDGLTANGRLTNKIVVTSVTGGTVTSPSTVPVDSSVVKDFNKANVSPDGIY